MTRPQGFWSSRKAAVVAEAKTEAQASIAQQEADARAALEEKTDAEILEELNLPNPDQMGEGDDFSVFMKTIVPEHLRRRALRRLWSSNPVLANLDQLVDYGEDFTDSAVVVENLQTTYQVGKGMLKHIEEMARQAEEAENPPKPQDAEEAPETVLALEDDLEPAPEPQEPLQPAAPVAEDEPPFIRRKMRFEYAAQAAE